MPLRKLFLACIGLAAAARLFVLAFLPEEALSDALYHLSVTREVVREETFRLASPIATPFYNSLVASFSLFAGMDIALPFARIFPLAITIATFLAAFLLFRKVLGNSWAGALAFFAVSPWLMRYGAVNYPEGPATLLVIVATYAILKLKEGANANTYVFLSAVFISALAITKLNAALFAGILFIAAIYLLWKNKSNKQLASFVAITILLSSFWYVLVYIPSGGLETHSPDEEASKAELPEFAAALGPLSFPVFSYLSFYEFPPAQSFTYISWLDGIPYLLAALLFGIALLPLTFALLLGAVKLCRERTFPSSLILALGAISLLAVTAVSMRSGRLDMVTMRYLIPVMPLCGIFFAKGIGLAKSANLKRIILISFLVFALYSAVYVSASSLYYNGVYSAHNGLYTAASLLPEDAKIHSQEHGRALKFYSGMDYGEIVTLYDMPAEGIYAKLKEGGFTHLAKGCFRNRWGGGILEGMENTGYLGLIYEDGCSQLYRVN